MRPDGSAARVLVGDAAMPVFSPDGSKLAFVRGPEKAEPAPQGGFSRAFFTDLYVKALAGGEPTRVTNTPLWSELWPSWDPSGQRLVFTKMYPYFSSSTFVGFGNAVITVNADGSCPYVVASDLQTGFFGAAWQPGPGREAGAIAC